MTPYLEERSLAIQVEARVDVVTPILMFTGLQFHSAPLARQLSNPEFLETLESLLGSDVTDVSR
jgi:hypothetical protein